MWVKLEIGSVRPTETFIIEKYSHVMHIVSNVVGKLKESEDCISALFAGLPAGTVSGAPKTCAMELIDELEKESGGFTEAGFFFHLMEVWIFHRTENGHN